MKGRRPYLDEERRRAEHVGGVDAIKVSFDLGNAGPGCGGGDPHAEHGGDGRQGQVGAGQVGHSGEVPAKGGCENFISAVRGGGLQAAPAPSPPLLADEAGDGDHLRTGDVLDGEVDEGGDAAGEETHEEGQRPLEEDVLQDLPPGPAPPIVLEQIVFDDPASEEEEDGREEP